MTFAREALPWVTLFVLPALVAFALGRPGWGSALALGGVAVALFFRVPTRATEAAPEIILSPASGRITAVEEIEEPAVGPGPYQRVVIFLSVFDVHVQRAPVAGRVLSTVHRDGLKVAAFRDDAGEVNAGRLTVIERPGGERLGVRQIAGLIARRIVTYLEEGQVLERGQLIGLIQFGSRVDLYLPAGYEILVTRGDRVVDGKTPIARPETAPAEES